jgi:single-stranded-DNA-specific exonuclease
MICTKINRKTVPLSEALRKESQDLGISPVLMGILARRHLTDPQAIREFLDGKEQPFYNPFQLLHMDRAVERITEAISKEEKITIYGDYDVDGTSASSLLFLFFKSLGVEAGIYIPRRDTEGYGLNAGALQKIADEGTTLLITVDTGISGARVVAEAPSGLDIIITDHHLPPAELPEAYTVVNPNQPGDTYPCKAICGCGVAFKLCQALYQTIHHTDAFWTDFIELAAVATVADVVPLVDENREIVRRGLAKIRNTSLTGLRALLDAAVKADSPVTSETIGFGIGPRINAAGRLDDAMLAVHLLVTDDPETARDLAHELNDLNAKRQDISQKIFEEAETMLLADGVPHFGIVLAKEGWHPGVIGIVASRLTEKYHQPTILLSIKDHVAKGSCRSIPPVHLYHALEACREHLVQFGGHAQAAGLTMEEKKVDAFRRKFQETVKSILKGIPYEPEVEADYFLPEGETLTEADVHELERLQPFGQDNPAPILGFSKAVITDVRTMGREQNHLRLDILFGTTTYKGLLWQEGPRSHYFYIGEEAAVAFAPRLNTFRGITSVDLEIKAVDTPYRIVDWRYSNHDKRTILNNILQKDEKTVLYVGNRETIKELPAGTHVLLYGEPVPEGTRTVVFYDAGAGNILDEARFPLKQDQAGTLHLLFNREELVFLRDELKRAYPDVRGLRSCYAQMRNQIRMHDGCGENRLRGMKTPDGYVISQAVLELFRKLHLLTGGTDSLQVENPGSFDMGRTDAFREMQEQGRQQEEALYRLWHLKPERIAALWKHQRG